MSIEMKPIPFDRLMQQAMAEFEQYKTMFGVPYSSIITHRNYAPIFGTRLNSAVGPAAGPHTQLAQNLVAAYVAGGRFFELKTVQVLWGEQLGIQRPCIYVRDEAYNTEWSTELSPEQAAEEYIKAWLAIHLLSKEYNLGDENAFVFNMSVGYDLPGIQSPTVDRFIETMKNASDTKFWKDCIQTAKTLPFRQVDEDFIQRISPEISNNVTISTLHGCPPEQIQAIASYMLEEKHLHTYIKCNPTLIGYEKAKKLLEDLGYGDLSFDDSHFVHDMQFEDAVPMLEALLEQAEELELRFGVKLTNTFPVKNVNGELPGEQMYMSGKALFPLAMETAYLLCKAFDGHLPISFSGGADEQNIAAIYSSGIYPITVATALLKAGGYKNLHRMVEKCANIKPDFNGIDTAAVRKLVKIEATDAHLRRKERRRPAKPVQPPFSCGQCSICVDVCPNRANYHVVGMEKTVVHLDGPCNDCGNCASVCPFGFVPYADKFVLYPDEKTLAESTRDGFAFVEDGVQIRWAGQLGVAVDTLPQQAQQMIQAVKDMHLAQ